MSKLNDEQKQHIDRIATKMAENMQDRDTLARDKMLCSAFLIGLVQNHQKPEDGRLAFPIEASWSEASKRITDTELGLLHKLGAPNAPPMPGDDSFVGFLGYYGQIMLGVLFAEDNA